MKMTSYHRKKYGAWAGNPEGSAADPERCAKEVHSQFLFHQCSRKRGHGPEGAFCKQHDPDVVAARQKAAIAADLIKYRRKAIGRSCGMHAALSKIAEGHNDPRAVAVEALAKFDSIYPTEEK